MHLIKSPEFHKYQVVWTPSSKRRAWTPESRLGIYDTGGALGTDLL